MKAQLLTRLFKAMNEGQPALLRVASEIIDAEKRLGHSRLATQLEESLQSVPSPPAQPKVGELRELRPLSERQEVLVTLTQPEKLAHHMVLSPELESRFVRVEREFAARDRLAEYGLTPRRRVLLYGPPGCGKTLGASRLAWTTGLPLMRVRFDSLISSRFGQTASNLRKVFDHAKQTPSVLLLDECDYIAKSRTARQDVGEVARVVNSLLELLDDFNGPGLVVATTNLDRELDPALFRRFDDAFLISLPGPKEMKLLAQFALSGIRVSNDVEMAEVMGHLQGASAADVVRVSRDAAKLAVIEGEGVVQKAHLRAAVQVHLARSTPN